MSAMRTPARAGLVLLAAILAAAPAQTDRAAFDTQFKKGTDLVNANAVADGLRILEPLISDPAAADPAVAGPLEHFIGQAYYRSAKYADAERHWLISVDRDRQAKNRSGEARTLRALAQMRKNQGRYAEGVKLGTQAVDIYDSLGDTRN